MYHAELKEMDDNMNDMENKITEEKDGFSVVF